MAVLDEQVKNCISDCFKESWLGDHNFLKVPGDDECCSRKKIGTMGPKYLNPYKCLRERVHKDIRSMDVLTRTDGIQKTIIKKPVTEMEGNGKKFKRLKTRLGLQCQTPALSKV